MERKRRVKTPGLACALLVAMACLMLGGEARAHSFYCEASVEGDTVHVYSWFGGRRTTYPDAALVRVEAPDGTLLHAGKTDANGEYVFPLTVRVDLRIIVDGGTGHVAETTIPVGDMPTSLPAWAPGMNPGDMTAPDTVAGDSGMPPPGGAAGAGAGIGMDGAEMERLIRAAVQAQIDPLRREWRMYREARGLQDLLGGIGYILGVTGVAFYLLARRRRCGTASRSGGNNGDQGNESSPVQGALGDGATGAGSEGAGHPPGAGSC